MSTRTYDEMGTVDPSDDTIASETVKTTALGMIVSGSWSHCWLEYGAQTDQRILDAQRPALAVAGPDRGPPWSGRPCARPRVSPQ